jgi:hypothetical protein
VLRLGGTGAEPAAKQVSGTSGERAARERSDRSTNENGSMSGLIKYIIINFLKTCTGTPITTRRGLSMAGLRHAFSLNCHSDEIFITDSQRFFDMYIREHSSPQKTQ